jgi:hypothetical protein
MQTLITRQTAKISTANGAAAIALVHPGVAKQRSARTATVQGQAGRPRLLAVLLHALAAWTA